MTQVFLINSNTSPWTVPGDWNNANNQVELVGCGGNGALGQTGSNPFSGGGGGGGAYRSRLNLTLSGTVPFRVPAGGGGATTRFGSDGTTGTNFFGAQFGVTPAAGGSGGSGGAATEETGGTPPGSSPAGFAGGAGGASSVKNSSGGGGGGAAGPLGAGFGGGSDTTSGATGAGGGGGADNSSGSAGGNQSGTSGGAGGNGPGGTGGGAAGGNGGSGGDATANSGGGGGGCGYPSNITGLRGGDAASTTTWDSTHGVGGGGGGDGRASGNSSSGTHRGGNGGNYGGGGGGAGAPASGDTVTVGAGAGGLIAITYTPAVTTIWGWDQQGVGERMHHAQSSRISRGAAIMRGDDGTVGVKPFWLPDGFEQVASQDKHPRPERAAATMRGDDGIELFKTPSTFFQWQNLGWEEVPPWQPPHPRPERAGTLFGGDPGNELFQTPSTFFQWINLGFDQVPPWQPPHPTPEHRAAAVMRGDDGTQAILPFWRPDGFEQVSSQDRAWPTTSLKGAFLRGDDGIEAPFILFTPLEWPSPPTWNRMPWNRAAATALGSDSSVFPFTAPPAVIWGYEFQALLSRQAVRRSTLDRGSDGIEAPFITFIPTAWPSPDVDPRKRFELAGGLMRGIDGTEAPFAAFFRDGWEVPPPMIRKPRPEAAGSFLRGLDGTDAPQPPPPIVFFDVTASQDRYSRTRTYGALMPKADGIDSPFVQWFNLGFEETASQDRAWPTARNRAAGLMRGDDGTQAPLPVYATLGFDQVASQDRTWPAPRLRGAILRGLDGIESPFVQFFPLGWDQIFAQPPHRSFRSPEFGHQGIDAPFVNWIRLGFEQTLSQAPHIRCEHWGAIARGHDGIEFPLPPVLLAWFETAPPFFRHPAFRSPEFGDAGIASPLIQFFPFAFDEITSQPISRPKRSPEFGDAGIAAPQIAFTPLEWPWQPMYQHPRPERTAAIARGHDGIEFPLPSVQVAWFETTPPLTRKAFFHSPEFGDAGIASPLIQFTALEWPWVATYPHPRPERTSAVMRGLDSIEFPMPSVTIAWFETAPAQLRPKQRTVSALVHRNGFAGFPQWINLGFEEIFSQPPHPGYERRGAILKGDEGIANPVIRFTALEWPAPPMHKKPPSWPAGAFLRGDDGAYIQLTMPFTSWPEPPMYRHPRPERFGAIARGDEGIEAAFIPPFFISWWGEQMEPLRPQRRTTSALAHRIGIAAYSQWINLGFDQINSQEPRQRWERRGAIVKGDDGTQAAPILFQPYGWEVQPPQPPHPRPEKAGLLFGGDPGNEATQIRFFPYGWEVQPYQPPHTFIEKRGAIMKGDEGIQFPFIFLLPMTAWPEPPMHQRPKQWRGGAFMRGPDGTDAQFINFQPYGWEVPQPQPPHPRPERTGAILRGDEGNQAQLILFRPYGWEVQPFQPPRLRYELRGQMFRGDEGIQAPKTIFVPMGWEPTPPLFFRRPQPRVPVFLLQSVESYAKFIPNIVAAATAIITPYSAAATIGQREINFIINAFAAGVVIDRGFKKPQ